MSKIVSWFVILFWLLMTGWFIWREILPALPSLKHPSYKTLLDNKTISLPFKSRMGIYFLNNKIGYSETQINSLETGFYEITNQTRFDPSLLPLGFSEKNSCSASRKEVVFTGSSIIGPDYQLNSLQINFSSPLGNYELFGKREGDKLVITITNYKTSKTIRTHFPKDATVSDGLSPFLGMPNLSVGKAWTIQLINPIFFSLETIKAYVEEKTTLEWQGKSYEVYEVVLEYKGKGFKPRAWITPEGIILKQEILMNGLYLIKE